MVEPIKTLSEDEIKLYDRQIRLWGVEGQANLRNARVLMLNLTSVGVEVCKNLVLGGVGALTIVDGSKVLEQDLNVNFFLDKTQVGQLKLDACKERIQDMNPRVKLETVTSDWQELPDLADFVSKFSIVIATGLNGDEMKRVNEVTRQLNLPLYCSTTHGLYGFIFADLVEHKSVVKYDVRSNKKPGPIDEVSSIVRVSTVQENDSEIQNCLISNVYRSYGEISGDLLRKRYVSEKKQTKKISTLLPALLALGKFPSGLHQPIEDVEINAEELQTATLGVVRDLKLPEKIATNDPETVVRLARQAYCEYQPVSSILGGALAQDVINYLVAKEYPINNFVVLDGFKSEMPVYVL